MGGDHVGFKLHVAPHIKSVRDMPGVIEDFRLRRIAFGPVPILLQLFREREGVRHAFSIAARARVAVPVPRSPDILAALVDSGG